MLIKEHIYIDEGISGRKAEKRPEFMRMIATAKIKPKPFDVILVHKFDRFARSREDSVVYKSLLKKECGVRVVSITESIEDDKFSVILEAMLEAMAEYYSLNLADEVKKGMTEKAERGEFQSAAPFGYVMENKVLKTLVEEANIVKLIFNNYVNKNMTMKALAKYVNSLGAKSKRGNPFEVQTIRYMLNNPVYIGKARWTPTGKGKMRYGYTHADTIIRDSQHEPIIDVETWNKAQERVKEGRELYRKYENTVVPIKTWLKGIVICSECGHKFTVFNHKYMQCNAFLKGGCTKSSHTPIEKLETAVLEELKKNYSDEVEINIVPVATDIGTADELELIQARLERIEGKEDRINISYEDGIDTLDEYKEKKKRLSEEREDLKNALELLKNTIVENRHNNDIVNKITDVYELLTDNSVDMENKYQTAHLLIDHIVYSRDEKILKLIYR